MKNSLRLWLVALVSGFVMISCNSDDGSKTDNADTSATDQSATNTIDNDDAEFLSFAAYSGMKEVEAGKMAQEKGQSADVKNLAKMMVDDHTAMGDKVKALAAKKNVQLKDSLDADDMEDIRENKKTGKEFDRDYASDMVEDHEEVIKKFEDASNNAKDPEVKALATEALPKLRHHLEMSKTAKDKVKG